MTDKNGAALSTPSRESDTTNVQQFANKNNQNGTNGNNNRQSNTNANNPNNSQTQNGADGGGAAGSEGGVGTTGQGPAKNGVASGSCLAGPENPKTVSRKNAQLTNNEVIVHFDERVVVHTVPYWDPCGETYYDDDDQEQRGGPNCCTIL